MNDGDWVCCDPQCGNVNFARRTSCNRCGKGNGNDSTQEKTTIPSRKKLGHEIGKAAAEKSRGLFSADDWQCGRCGNVNWARRQQCNMCNAPKFGEVEERTGLGGGYNERENVEYIERDESDGEYDDFGRKKKKYRGNEEENVKVKPSSVKASLPEVQKEISKNNEEEEEEEEEEEDDADLSKYDLSGWGDDDSDKEQDKKKSRSPASSQSSRSSRSRSSSHSSSRSSSPSTSSDSGKLARRKRTHSRSRSPSYERNKEKKRGRSRSPLHISSTRPRDRSDSSSPISRKR